MQTCRMGNLVVGDKGELNHWHTSGHPLTRAEKPVVFITTEGILCF